MNPHSTVLIGSAYLYIDYFCDWKQVGPGHKFAQFA